MGRWEGRPAVGRGGTRAPPGLLAQGPGRGFRRPKTCLQLRLDAWNGRREAILRCFSLLRDGADGQRWRPRWPSTQARCVPRTAGPGFPAPWSKRPCHEVAPRRCLQKKTFPLKLAAGLAPRPSALTVEEVGVHGLLVGGQVHEEPGAASSLRGEGGEGRRGQRRRPRGGEGVPPPPVPALRTEEGGGGPGRRGRVGVWWARPLLRPTRQAPPCLAESPAVAPHPAAGRRRRRPGPSGPAAGAARATLSPPAAPPSPGCRLLPEP